ncbi:hypothetical protein G6F68_019809 [Rhizopus microsporus]|nr:hypothetical protein G6F68_019809 [Rhizopus microsporus]
MRRVTRTMCRPWRVCSSCGSRPPEGNAKTARSNSGTVSPRPNWPRLPPTVADGQLDCSRATSAKREGSASSSCSTTLAWARSMSRFTVGVTWNRMWSASTNSPTMKRCGCIW